MLGFASKNGAELDFLNAGFLDFLGQVFVDVRVYVAQNFAGNRVDNALDCKVAFDAVGQMLDDFVAVLDGRVISSVDCAAIVLVDDNVLGNVNQTAGHVTGVGCLKSGVRQTFAGAVCRDEVFDYRKSFVEV